LARDGKCTEAIDPLTRAEELFHAPTILVELGFCLCEVGRLVEGTESLNKVVREDLGDSPPEAFEAAQDRAAKLLEEYLPRLSQLVIHIEAPEGSQVEVTVDGQTVADALVGAPRPTDPGERLVAASGAGLKSTETTVVLEEASRAEVTLVLEPDPNAATSDVDLEGTGDPTPADTPPATKAKSPVPAYVAFGIGAVGLGLGSIFGLSAISNKKDLDSRCIDGACPRGSQDDISKFKRNANLSTVGFGVGIVGVGVGVALLISGGKSKTSAGCERDTCVTPVVGLGHLGLEGTF